MQVWHGCVFSTEAGITHNHDQGLGLSTCLAVQQTGVGRGASLLSALGWIESLTEGS